MGSCKILSHFFDVLYFNKKLCIYRITTITVFRFLICILLYLCNVCEVFLPHFCLFWKFLFPAALLQKFTAVASNLFSVSHTSGEISAFCLTVPGASTAGWKPVWSKFLKYSSYSFMLIFWYLCIHMPYQSPQYAAAIDKSCSKLAVNEFQCASFNSRTFACLLMTL